MKQVAFISPHTAYVIPPNNSAPIRSVRSGWSMPAAEDTAQLWQQVNQLKTQLSGINQRRNGTDYREVKHQLSRVALLLMPCTTDLALASILLKFLTPDHLAIGQAQVQSKARRSSGQSLTVLDTLDQCVLMHLLTAVYGDIHCQAVIRYVNQRLANVEND